MGKKINVYFDKLYKYAKSEEHVSVAIPVKKGELKDIGKFSISKDDKLMPVQTKVTSRYDDGSVRYMFIRFLADLPANKSCVYTCDFEDGRTVEYDGIKIVDNNNGFEVDTNAIKFNVENDSSNLFANVLYKENLYNKEQFVGPVLKDGNGNTYGVKFNNWRIVEKGQLVTILACDGSNNLEGQMSVNFEVRITAYANKPWVEVSYRIINTTYDPLHLASLVFYINDKNCVMNDSLKDMALDSDTDSTGCGDGTLDNSDNMGPIFHTRGLGELDFIEKRTPVEDVRTIVGSSNYKTDFYIGKSGEEVNKVVDAKFLLKEANEHFAEVLYGTFFADRTDSKGGVCATVYQAQQNFPKAVKADKNGIALMLVPENVDKVVMQSGMAREQRFLLHFHDAEEQIWKLDDRSLIYQMPDRPYVLPEVFKESGTMIDVFPDVFNENFEIMMMERADKHARCYGMLNWGDAPDPGYTNQGRGNGEQVWVNNEYDYPHACALQYARTGIRRFLDYNFVSASHWMDVDVCHFSDNPLRIGGMWEHTAGHTKNGLMVCSHEWVEGLLDYYHLSGDDRGLETALGIGENVLKLLDTPMYQVPGEANARETGWALRALTALYIETSDKKWIAKAEWIIDSFKIWEKQYGGWLAPYTDNTSIRTGFMIGVAAGSLMRYYRVFPSEDIKNMIVAAVDDIIENGMLPNGLFYYKELPSLSRNGNNTLLLELLTIAYELTGDVTYLSYGLRTFRTMVMSNITLNAGGKKQMVEDTVIVPGMSPKNFGQSFIPIVTYYKAVSDNYQKLLEKGMIKYPDEMACIFT